MIQHSCLSCRHGWTDLKASVMPPPARKSCPQCGRQHVMVSQVSRPQPRPVGAGRGHPRS